MVNSYYAQAKCRPACPSKFDNNAAKMSIQRTWFNPDREADLAGERGLPEAQSNTTSINLS